MKIDEDIIDERSVSQLAVSRNNTVELNSYLKRLHGPQQNQNKSSILPKDLLTPHSIARYELQTKRHESLTIINKRRHNQSHCSDSLRKQLDENEMSGMQQLKVETSRNGYTQKYNTSTMESSKPQQTYRSKSKMEDSLFQENSSFVQNRSINNEHGKLSSLQRRDYPERRQKYNIPDLV